MGNSGPSTSKQSGTGTAFSLGLKWGHSGMQGWRVSMEDAHFAVPSMPGPGWEGTAGFGVLDGHGGADVAKFCASRLPAMIAAQSASDPSMAILAAFYKLDDLLVEVPELDHEAQGCTAVVCCVTKDNILVGNAGDSRAVLCRGGKAIPLSYDHKPSDAREQRRVEKAGGVVVSRQGDPGGPRVQGDLNLSRSLGDHRHKQDRNLNAAEQIITCTPDIRNFQRCPNDEFMIIACDGVWDVLSNDDAVGFVRQRLPLSQNTNVSLSKIMEEMMDACLSPDLRSTGGLGGDNMTAVLVVFDNTDIVWGIKHLTAMLGCN